MKYYYYKFDMYDAWECPDFHKLLICPKYYNEDELYSLIGTLMKKYMDKTNNTRKLIDNVLRDLQYDYDFIEISIDTNFYLENTNIHKLFNHKFVQSDPDGACYKMCVNAGCDDKFAKIYLKYDDMIKELKNAKGCVPYNPEYWEQYIDNLIKGGEKK